MGSALYVFQLATWDVQRLRSPMADIIRVSASGMSSLDLPRLSWKSIRSCRPGVVRLQVFRTKFCTKILPWRLETGTRRLFSMSFRKVTMDCAPMFYAILPYFARAWLAWYVWTSQLNHHQPPNHSRALEKGGTPDVAKEVHVFGGLQGRLEGPGQPPEVGVP